MTKITNFFRAKGAVKKIGNASVKRTHCDGKITVTPVVSGSNKKSKSDDAKSTLDEDARVLLSHLDDGEESSCIGWKSALRRQFESPSFAQLSSFVAKERRSGVVYPAEKDTWTALNACSIDKIKVVIVGQDPYHGPNQAHGLCFSVLPGQATPPSLKNVYKELASDPDVSFPPEIPKHGYLMHWAKQGVLLLNTVMTVRKGQANSHKNKGWENVTNEIIKAVDKDARAQGRGVVFLLWGIPAKKKALQLVKEEAHSPHTIICTSHPSPLGARKTASPFIGSKCFSRCNKALETMGLTPIDWNVDTGTRSSKS